MIDSDDVLEVMEKFRRVTVTELASILEVPTTQIRALLKRPEVAGFTRDTGDRFQNSPIIAFKPRAQLPHPREIPRPRDPLDGLDPMDPFKGLPANARIRVENIMQALAKIAPTNDAETIPRYSQHLAYARALPHVKPTTRRVPMSEHQRYMDRLGSGVWATVVRADMRRSGLLPSRAR